MNPIKICNGLTYRPGWKPMPKNYGHAMKWKQPAVNRTLSVMINKPANTSFMTVRRKARKAAEASVSTVLGRSREKNTDRN
jgi:hypothetical protein